MKKLFRFRARDGYIFLTSYIGDDEVIIVPDTYNGKPVTGITRNCFDKCDYKSRNNIKKIILPESVVIIEQFAFSCCENLEEIILSKNLKLIKNQAFWKCKSLTQITFFENVETIGSFAFGNCNSLKKIICKNDDIKVAKSAFPKELPLEIASFNIIKQLDHSFQVNLIYKLLEKFDELSSEEQKEILAFINRKQNLKKELFFIADNNIITLLLQENIKLQLNFVNELIDFNIKKENTLINAILLDYKEKNFSKKETELSLERKELVDIGFETPTFGELRQNWKFSKRDGEIVISGYKGISSNQTIPKHISDGTPITKLEIKENGDYKRLENLIIEAEITRLEYYTFGLCEKLKEIILPESLTVISGNTFCYSKALESVKSFDNLEFIGDRAFIGCKALREFNFSKNLTYIGVKSFCKCKELTVVSFGNKLKTISEYAFSECEKITEIIIPPNTTKLGAYAFQECSSLEKVEILSNLKMIEESTFSNCNNLKEIILPDTLEVIGYLAFSNCTNLEKITIPASVKSIYFMAFRNCVNLKKVNFLGENISIDGSAFEGTPLEKELN